MELIYLWIKDYKNIEELDCSLNINYEKPDSTKYDTCKDSIKYDTDEDCIKIKLSRNDNLNIFGNKLNIKTFVGKNGSGKSNIISAIANILKDGYVKETEDYASLDLPEKYCLILSENGEYSYKSNVDKVDIIINGTRVENNYKPLIYAAIFKPFLNIEDENPLEFLKDESQKEIIKIKLRNYFYYDRFRVYDTTQSVKALYKKHAKHPFLFLNENKTLLFDKYTYEIDVKNELEWINRKLTRLIPVYYRPENWIYKDLWTFLDSLKDHNNYIIEHINEKDSISEFYDSILPDMCFMFSLIKFAEMFSRLEGNENILDVNTFVYYLTYLIETNLVCKHEKLREFYKDTKEKIEKKCQDNEIKKRLEYNGFLSMLYCLLDSYIELEDSLANEKYLFEDYLEKAQDNLYLYRIKKMSAIGEDISTNQPLMKFSKLGISRLNFYNVSPNGQIYSFFNLSTGEQRLLRFFADVLSVIESTDIFIFDEMDLSWHPEWQRNMILYIVDLFNKVTANDKDKKINLIFTTHSPFILSDMPKENVVLLKRNENGNTVVDSNKNDTFGANIHTLLAKSFFMKSTMGAFAQKKIQEAAQELNNNSKEEKNDVYQQVIKLLDDDNIYKKILERMNWRSSEGNCNEKN